jgi:predicted GNAT family N-acyltransferase
MIDLSFKIIKYASFEYEAAIKLREGILRKPLGLVFLPEEIEAEKEHIQIAGFQGEELISTAVLVPEFKDYKMQRVVVKQGLQGSGVGSKMMKFCEEYARNQGAHSIYCHARDSAVNFYLKNNWVAEGDYFNEDTIPHLKMRKVCDNYRY